VLNCWK